VPENKNRPVAKRPRHRTWWFGPALFSWLLLASAPTFADAESTTEIPQKRFEFSGFGTLGLAATDNNDAQFIRDQSQPRGIGQSVSGKLDSLLGVQAYFRATDSLEFVSQAIARYGPQGNFKPDISLAFAKFALASNNLVLRVGRMGTEFYMLADSRHVAYSYLTVRPSVDFFGGLAFHYVDGADLLGTTTFGDGVLKVKAFAGQADELAPIVDEFLSLRGNPMSGAYVDYQQGNWQWRATYAQMTFKHDLPAPVSTLQTGLSAAGANAAARAIGLTDTTSRFYSLGAVYDRGPLQVQAMLSQTDHQSYIYQNTRAGYLIAGYRFGEFTPFTGYSWSKSKSRQLSSGLPDLPFFAPLNAGLAGALARVHTDQHTYTVGTRWDFRQNMALKAQLDCIRGKPESIFLYPSSNPESFNGKLNVFSLSLDFVF